MDEKQRAKQRAKQYAKQIAKRYVKQYIKKKVLAALIAFFKTPPGLITAGVIILLLIIIISLLSFIEAGEISNNLDEKQNQQLQKEIIDIARDKSGILLDYYGTDEEMTLNGAWVLSYYKYLQLIAKADTTKAEDSDKIKKEKIKMELVNLAERMKPRFLYIRTQCKTVTTKNLYYSMPRTYTWTESGTKTKTVTVKWTEKVEVTQMQPVWLLVAADTIKQKYTISYNINEYKRIYQNGIPQRSEKTKIKALALDFDPQNFIKQKNCYHASDLGIATKFEIKTNFDKADKEIKPSITSKTLQISPQIEDPPFTESVTTSYVDGEKKIDREEILQIVETIPEIDIHTTFGKEYERLEELIKEDNPNEDITLVKSMIINAALSFMSGTKDASWMFSDINDYMNISGYTSYSYIPAQFLPMFKEAEKLFGIPYWFLAAVSYRESSFNPAAKTPNYDGIAVGLMQVQQKYWNDRVESFKKTFPNVVITGDITNPRDQILIGAMTLYDSFKQMGINPETIDWQSDGWKESVIPALAGYWMGVGGAKQIDAPQNFKKTRNEYAPKLIEYAEQFKTVSKMLSNQDIAKPIAGTINITSPFGMRFHPIYHVWKIHNGIDIATTYNQPVFAVKDSIVKYVGWISGYGKVIILQAGEYEFYYAHLADIDVAVGQHVNKGQKIGGADSTGNSTGNHLHFEVRINGVPQDPLVVLGNLQ